MAAYPGSFDPPTVAHLAIAEAARRQFGLERVDLIVSRVALGKDHGGHAGVDDRVAVLRVVAATRPWLGVEVTEARLLADVADGYDVVVMGADKWAQVLDPAWYDGSVAARDEAVARLPEVAVAPRVGWPVPAAGGVTVLDVHPDHHPVSSTEVRAGRPDWMLPEAAASGLW